MNPTDRAAIFSPLILSVCLGCQVVSDTSDVRVIGGEGVTSSQTFPGSVAIVLPAAGVARGQVRCTMTKIGARHFLTAGHCMTLTRGGVPSVERYPRGTILHLDPGPIINFERPAFTVTVAALHVNSSYSTYTFGGEESLSERSDVAIVEVMEDTPGLRPISIDTSPIDVGAEVVFTGFGCEEWRAMTPIALSLEKLGLQTYMPEF